MPQTWNLHKFSYSSFMYNFCGYSFIQSIFTSASIFKKSEDIKMDMTFFGSVGKKKKETKHFQVRLVKLF